MAEYSNATGKSTRICVIMVQVDAFEENPVSEQEMAQRIKDVSANLLWYVEELDGELLAMPMLHHGACAVPTGFLWEVQSTCRPNIYVKESEPDYIYQVLIDDRRSRGIQVMLGGIAQPNAASVALHEWFGVEKVAHFEDVGRKFEQWVDVGYWELRVNSALS
ncbi:MAG: GNAT family N-acetyltransferase [Burkholderiales bacterium]|nr:GNAT family N-acetyltransferase [Burkholderiales bacterium]MBI3729923.1 GNAT family N-acetyltransferase [Burkholderiales bacterium]